MKREDIKKRDDLLFCLQSTGKSVVMGDGFFWCIPRMNIIHDPPVPIHKQIPLPFINTLSFSSPKQSYPWAVTVLRANSKKIHMSATWTKSIFLYASEKKYCVAEMISI